MEIRDAELLFTPDSAELRFLPEGPYPLGPDRFSWVAIQHGAEATIGSLNIYDAGAKKSQSFPLPGRPGFAFPTTRDGVFVVGAERSVGLFDTADSSWTPWDILVDAEVSGTIINDGMVFEHGLIFGTKDLEFKTKKAGLYFWRQADERLFTLADDQVCSNGKVVCELEGKLTLLDIDSPTRMVSAYDLDVDAGTISNQRMVVDLREEKYVPDGMIQTPCGKSLVVAMYNPTDVPHGEARQYSIATGEVEAVWRCARAPQVTCPQLVMMDGQVKLVLTSAVEHMNAERLAVHCDSGSLFVGETTFDQLGAVPRYRV